MSLKRLMDEAYQGKVRKGRLNKRKDDFVLGFEDLTDRLGKKVSKKEVQLLAPAGDAIFALIRTANVEDKRDQIVWGLLTSIAAEQSREPLHLVSKDFAGLELASGTMILTGESDHIGERMTGGKIIVNGKAGNYLGQEMKGGGIIAGSCGDYGFRNMSGGWGVVLGDASNYLGVGNSGGKIVAKGNSGDRTGWLMSGGRLRVKGDTGQYLGLLMSAGQISVGGRAGAKAGCQMRDGKITATTYGAKVGSGKIGGKILRRKAD
jgi:formylmethanofuran dehydrogenase subunit C